MLHGYAKKKLGHGAVCAVCLIAALQIHGWAPTDATRSSEGWQCRNILLGRVQFVGYAIAYGTTV
jgi:hypothetical protein